MKNQKNIEFDEETIKRQAIEDYKKTQTFSIMEFAKQLQQYALDNMNESRKKKFYKKYRPQDVDKYLSNPAKYEKQLRNVSRYLAVTSPHYWNLINYFPNMSILSPIIVPFNTNNFNNKKTSMQKIKKEYNKCIVKLDNMNISHEFLKIIQVAFREDVFYGIEVETENSYSIKQLDPDYCRIKGSCDGCLTFEFDFTYFDIYKKELRYFYNIDKDFVRKYNLYKKKGNDYRWQMLEPTKEICVKYQSTFDFCCPPYISVFNDLYDITDYKDMNKAKVEMDNTKFIGFEMKNKGEKSNKIDDFVLNVDTMKAWFSFIQGCLNGQVGAFMSPMPFKEIEFAQTSSDTDNVSNSISTYWKGTGTSEVLFGNNTTAGTLAYSIITDQDLLFNLYTQLERILSRKFKLLSDDMFVIHLPRLTRFNVEDETDRYLKLSQYGYQGARTLTEACMGLSQNKIEGLGFLENNILNKQDSMIPVSSSYTQSEESDGGRPSETDDTKISESSQQTRDNGSNANR